MKMLRDLVLALPLLLLVPAGLAQSANTPAAPAPDEAAPSQAPIHRHMPKKSCWKEAGITADQMNQRWKLLDEEKGRISVACHETKTTAEQKQAKIKEIQKDTELSIAQLVGEKQYRSYTSCEAEQAKEQPRRTGPPEKELGPCGGTIPNSAAMGAMHDHEHEHQ